jgi:uncharacterized membrane protein YebE (DUF533 family)
MSAQTLLEQLLKSGLSMIQGGGQPSGGAGLPVPQAPQRPPAMPGASGPSSGSGGKPFDWGTFAGGAASGGALALLLGSKRGRSYAGKAVKLGSVAALGALAYTAYTRWQEQQRQGAAGGATGGTAGGAMGGTAGSAAASMPAAAAPTPRTVNLLPAPEVEQHSHAMLKAMVAAAKSDGHLDERERGLLESELGRLEGDQALRSWLEQEIRKPLDPADVARAATTPELAAEMYLASLLVADETTTMERLYLDELARQLKLPDGLKAQLEAQALSA